MRLAYLTNRYPAVSHSFIRREIAAMESAGHSVQRFSIQAPDRNMVDARDLAEVGRTVAILPQGIAALLRSGLAMLARRPGRWFAALACAWRMARPGVSGKIRAIAYLLEACLLVRHFAAHPVDHLHVHFGTNPADVARIVFRLGGPGYSFTVHGPDEFDDPRGLDLAGKVADSRFVVAISDFGRSQLLRWSALGDWRKVIVVRCGLDETFLAAPGPSMPDPRALCCVSRLAPQKGLPLLIEACGVLKAEGTDFRLTIIGDGDLRLMIEARIAALGLGDQIVLAGVRDGAGVRAELLRSRAFVLPSFAEGLPVVIMEALALERPVIVSAIAGTPELVDARCGWLFPAGNVAKVADAMKAALAAPADEIARMGQEGRRRVLDQHDAVKNAEIMSRALAEFVVA